MEMKDKFTKFVFKVCLGRGSFGSVYLVENAKISNSDMALKLMVKEKYVQTRHASKAMRERSILMQINHKNVIKLLDSFQTPRYICLLTEYEPCLDIWSFQRKHKRSSNGTFKPAEAKTTAAQVFHALSYLHGLFIIYRDLKTENIIMFGNGRIKLIDFGFAKRLDEKGRTGTMCGTPEYIAPEIIANQPYTFAVDWWSFGILIYELLYGYTPFSMRAQGAYGSNDLIKQYDHILNRSVPFSIDIDPIAKDLINRLLKKDFNFRLGHIYRGSSEIINHPWFDRIDDLLREMDYGYKLEPPTPGKEKKNQTIPKDFMKPLDKDLTNYFPSFQVVN